MSFTNTRFKFTICFPIHFNLTPLPNFPCLPNTLYSPQVETFGSMEKKEKVEFILEQMRLCYETKDYIRTSIISKKISTKYFDSKVCNYNIHMIVTSDSIWKGLEISK